MLSWSTLVLGDGVYPEIVAGPAAGTPAFPPETPGDLTSRCPRHTRPLCGCKLPLGPSEQPLPPPGPAVQGAGDPARFPSPPAAGAALGPPLVLLPSGRSPARGPGPAPPPHPTAQCWRAGVARGPVDTRAGCRRAKYPGWGDESPSVLSSGCKVPQAEGLDTRKRSLGCFWNPDV